MIKIITKNYGLTIRRQEVVKIVKTKSIKKAISIAKMFAKRRLKVLKEGKVYWEIYGREKGFISFTVAEGYIEKACGMYLYHYSKRFYK